MKRVFLFLLLSPFLLQVVSTASPPVYPDNCFFSVQKDSLGTWWIVDPNGKTFWSKGIDVMHPQGDTDRVTGKQPYLETVLAKYGNTTNWANAAVQRVLEWNINTLGAWTNALFFDMHMPYTIVLGLLNNWAQVSCKGCYIPDLYDPGFEANTKKIVRTQVLPHANNPYFLGYFLDNEIYLGPDWHLNVPLFSYYINFTTNSAGWQAAIAYAKSLYGTVENVNKAWGLNLTTWNNLNNIRIPPSAKYGADSPGFDSLTAIHFFNVTCTAIRNVDPNHLILGTKFDGFPSEQVIEADAKYGSDILSIDWYQWPAPTYGSITTLWNLSKKPILFGEFAYRGNDTGLPNTKGAGPVVATQALRAEMYSEFMRNMSKLNYTVGAFWFEWVDEPINGRSDGENSNYGVVNVQDEVYVDLTNAMATVNPMLDLLHGPTRLLPAQCKPRYYCPNGCSGNGCCDTNTGRCVCNSIFSGGDCSIPAGYLNENFGPSDTLDNWSVSNGNWGNYYTYFRSEYAYSLSSEFGLALHLNKTGCPAQCGNSAYAGSGIQSEYVYSNGWLNLTVQGSPVENAVLKVQWINTDVTGAVDGYQYQINQTGAILTSIYDSVYTNIGEIGLKFNQSTAFHTYGLFWGSNNQVKFTVDGQIMISSSISHKYNNGNINIYFIALSDLAKNIDFTSVYIREVQYLTELGNVPAHCGAEKILGSTMSINM